MSSAVNAAEALKRAQSSGKWLHGWLTWERVSRFLLSPGTEVRDPNIVKPRSGNSEKGGQRKEAGREGRKGKCLNTNGLRDPRRFFAVFDDGGMASPATLSYLHSSPAASPEPPQDPLHCRSEQHHFWALGRTRTRSGAWLEE